MTNLDLGSPEATMRGQTTCSAGRTSADSSFTIESFLFSSCSGEGVTPPVSLVMNCRLSPGGGNWPGLTSRDLEWNSKTQSYYTTHAGHWVKISVALQHVHNMPKLHTFIWHTSQYYCKKTLENQIQQMLCFFFGNRYSIHLQYRLQRVEIVNNQEKLDVYNKPIWQEEVEEKKFQQ